MELSDRIKYLRKEYLKKSQTDFGEMLGVKRDVINNIENNRLKNPQKQEPLYRLICSKCNLNEEWLRNGTGEMFRKELKMDETAEIVGELLSESNPLYDIIKEIMHTYSNLTPNSKKVLLEFSKSLLDNLKYSQKEG